MNCKNCQTVITPNTNFCNSCGAKVIRNRLTLKAIFTSFSEQFLNYDNKFLKTFLHLFSKPQEVIGGYINGTRKKYVNVISYFAIAITISGLQIFILQKFFPEVFELNIPTAKGQEEMQKKISEFTFEYNSFILMAFIPIFALMAKITFLNIKKFNYTELIVILMYINAQTTIFGSILAILFASLNLSFIYVSMILIPINIIYTAFCFKRLYGLSLKRIILKTLLFIVVLLVTYITFIILSTLIVFLFTNF